MDLYQFRHTSEPDTGLCPVPLSFLKEQKNRVWKLLKSNVPFLKKKENT